MSESSDLFIALGGVFKRLKNRTQPESASLAGVPLAPRHIPVLMHIAQDAPIGMSDLAVRMNVSLATMSQLVTDLEGWGLATRRTDPSDRRRTLVDLPEERRPSLQLVFNERLRPLDRTLRRLEPDERAGLIRGLTILAEELDRADEPMTSLQKENAR